MSGTSADGVDAILLEFEDIATPHMPRVLGRQALAYPPELQQKLLQPHALRAAEIAQLHALLPQLYAEAAMQLPDWQTAACVGMHGQTLVHNIHPQAGVPAHTLQIGSTAVLAARMQLPVIGDMRAVDVALGGQGAPLVPLAHWFFLGAQSQSSFVVNFGGICNVTLATPAMADVRGFDVGPGMMLSDAHAMRASNHRLSCDRDGVLSRGGRSIDKLLAAVLAHPFVARKPPKSAGREEFGAAFCEPLLRAFADCADADVAYTLHQATAQILAQATRQSLPANAPVRQVVLTGGGACNPTLRQLCVEALAPAEVRVEEQGVFAPQNHEPAAMAFIALRTLHNMPSSLPQVTGAATQAILGHVHQPPGAQAVRAQGPC